MLLNSYFSRSYTDSIYDHTVYLLLYESSLNTIWNLLLYDTSTIKVFVKLPVC